MNWAGSMIKHMKSIIRYAAIAAVVLGIGISAVFAQRAKPKAPVSKTPDYRIATLKVMSSFRMTPNRKASLTTSTPHYLFGYLFRVKRVRLKPDEWQMS